MKYAHRNSEGKLLKLTNQPNGSGEQIEDDDQEVIDFLDDSQTMEQVYDKTISGNKLIKALVLSLNDGSFIPGNNLTGQELKQIILSKM